MKETETVNMFRRKFLAASPFLFLGAGSLKAFPFTSQTTPRGPDLRETLSPEESIAAKNSTMASDMDNFWGKGYSWAETGLAVSLRYLKKPEDLLWVAGGFGGGMGHQDLCGFLTAGIMAIGLFTSTLKLDKKAAKALCSRKVKEYWDYWKSTAPLHCAEIREGHKGFNVCQRLGKLASVKLEELLKM